MCVCVCVCVCAMKAMVLSTLNKVIKLRNTVNLQSYRGLVFPPYLGKGKDLYFVFLDLEKAYDKVDRDTMWNVLRLYGIGGRLLQGVKRLYVGSKACVRVGNEVSEWFPVRVGLRQGCVMSPWLLNLYADGVVREVSA